MTLQNKFLSKELSNKFWKEGLTLSTAESCTSGSIASVITATPGSSHFYKGGIVAYSDELKINLLGVNPETIATWFADEFRRNPDLKDELMNYPVFSILSDGDFSSSRGAKQAILDFQKIMEENIGFCPFIMLIEVTTRTYTDARKFEGIDNFLWINSNPAQIEQVLVNFKDMDMMDVYASLQSMFRSNRYAPVRENVL